MTKCKTPTYTVIRDSREQTGWFFSAGKQCDGTLIKGLKTGDYSLIGFEEKFVIERKRNTGEFAMNIIQPRFERELERLDKFEHAFLICEFTLDDIERYPENSGIPQRNWKHLRVKPPFLKKRLMEMQIQHSVRFIFAGRHGKSFAEGLFKRMVEHEQKTADSKCEDADSAGKS